MKIKRFAALFFVVLLATLLFVGCGKGSGSSGKPASEKDVADILASAVSSSDLSPEAQKLCGKWAYIHDPENPSLVLSADGRAVLDGILYNYECDGQFITLKSIGRKDIKMRYVFEKENLYIYKTTVYKFQDKGKPEDLTGLWKNEENNWSFEFSDKGTFVEDGYFPGYYLVDAENGTFLLAYNDHFEDTTCYYNINGKNLTVEYPWLMVRAQ